MPSTLPLADRSAYLLAARGERPPHTPVWFMRQAGRALPEYRAVREGISMLESCMRPELVVEITLQPVRRYGVDAAIFYSDIVLPLKAAGFDIEIKPGVGPVVADPIRDAAGVATVRPVTPADVTFTTESVRQLVTELAGTPLIGFAGAPFTVASYLVEGGPSKDYAKTKAMMHGNPELWHALADRLADVAIAYLSVQVEAGASAIQLFDSWAGGLSPRDYERFVLPHSAKVLDAMKAYDVPRVHFGVNTGELLGLMSAAGADVVGVDWRVPLDEAVRRITAAGGAPKPVQGNLDPALLFAGWDAIEPELDRILEEGKAAPGHIFNLGHGVPPNADPDVLTRVVKYVQSKK
ncbi:uroporphyrinogen decarboxylase [Kribbella solani]|uniref:uroporphyrinogen decarboxylase n=1 Tax=Kribbella solani TaxID=236067 RepID=UPI0029A80CFE|nr:uroporphyrinogen decarboxylase [Kribbella solani]MDX2971329.1 uroporphyrinogen decarboxylase [Kribbella solani]MDX3000578.1 uroporphyrinogen decarboxylase [Kribbella solani]